MSLYCFLCRSMIEFTNERKPICTVGWLIDPLWQPAPDIVTVDPKHNIEKYNLKKKGQQMHWRSEPPTLITDGIGHLKQHIHLQINISCRYGNWFEHMMELGKGLESTATHSHHGSAPPAATSSQTQHTHIVTIYKTLGERKPLNILSKMKHLPSSPSS